MLRRPAAPHDVWLLIAWLGGLLLLAVVAAGGHAITGRWVVLGVAATVAHLAAMAVWLGGLAAIAATVPRQRMLRMATAFSPIALVAVVVLAVTGTLNAWRQSGSWDALVHSRYGTWLIVKLVIIVGVLALALASRWVTARPSVERPQPRPAPHRRRRGGRHLRRHGRDDRAGQLTAAARRGHSVESVTVVQGNRIAQLIARRHRSPAARRCTSTSPTPTAR